MELTPQTINSGWTEVEPETDLEMDLTPQTISSGWTEVESHMELTPQHLR